MSRYFPEEVKDVFEINSTKIISWFTFALIGWLLLYSCTQMTGYFGVKEDGPLEEAMEELIKEKTYLDLDLTPDSYEP